jgi:hypothetical protein
MKLLLPQLGLKGCESIDKLWDSYKYEFVQDSDHPLHLHFELLEFDLLDNDTRLFLNSMSSLLLLLLLLLFLLLLLLLLLTLLLLLLLLLLLKLM